MSEQSHRVSPERQAKSPKSPALRARGRKSAPRVDGKAGRSNDLAWHPVFLKALHQSPNLSAAARAAGITMKTARQHKAKFKDFADAWEEAMDSSVDNLVGEAYRRAFIGVPRPIYQQGKKVGEVREYSDTLTIFLLRSHRPSVYGDKTKIEHSGTAVPMTAEETIAAGQRFQEGLISTIKASIGIARPRSSSES